MLDFGVVREGSLGRETGLRKGFFALPGTWLLEGGEGGERGVEVVSGDRGASPVSGDDSISEHGGEGLREEGSLKFSLELSAGDSRVRGGVLLRNTVSGEEGIEARLSQMVGLGVCKRAYCVLKRIRVERVELVKSTRGALG